MKKLKQYKIWVEFEFQYLNLGLTYFQVYVTFFFFYILYNLYHTEILIYYNIVKY